MPGFRNTRVPTLDAQDREGWGITETNRPNLRHLAKTASFAPPSFMGTGDRVTVGLKGGIDRGGVEPPITPSWKRRFQIHEPPYNGPRTSRWKHLIDGSGTS